MPKPMRIMVEVEEIAHGRVFRLLDGTPGVIGITPIGDGPKPQNAGSSKGQKKGGAQTAPCLVLGALIESPGANRTQLAAVLELNGKKATSLPDTLQKLRKAKEITSKGKGKDVSYSITPVGRKKFATACAIQPPAREK